MGNETPGEPGISCESGGSKANFCERDGEGTPGASCASRRGVPANCRTLDFLFTKIVLRPWQSGTAKHSKIGQLHHATCSCLTLAGPMLQHRRHIRIRISRPEAWLSAGPCIASSQLRREREDLTNMKTSGRKLHCKRFSTICNSRACLLSVTPCATYRRTATYRYLHATEHPVTLRSVTYTRTQPDSPNSRKS